MELKVMFGGYVVQSSTQSMANAKDRSWCSGFGPLGSENVHGWKFCSLLEQPFTMLNCNQRDIFPHIWNWDVLWSHIVTVSSCPLPWFFIHLRRVQFSVTSKQRAEGSSQCPHLVFTPQKKHNSPRSLTLLLCHVFQPPPFPFFVCWIHWYALGFTENAGDCWDWN